MTEFLHVLRVYGDRTAKIQRYRDRGFYVKVSLPQKLAEGRRIKLNVFDTYSDFYHAEVAPMHYERKVPDYEDLTDRYGYVSDAFTVEIFPSRRNKYYRLKKRLVDSIEGRGLQGIANKCFNNIKGGDVPKSGFLRFSRKAEEQENDRL